MERRIRREVEELLNEFSELNGKAVNPTDLTDNIRIQRHCQHHLWEEVPVDRSKTG